MVKSRLLLLILFCWNFTALAEDTTVVKKDKWANYEHKPKRAALWSLFPGGGQIYNEIGYRRIPKKKNRAWWKVPIIYGGLGACGYYYYINLKQTLLLKEEILFRRDNPGSTLHDEFLSYQDEDDLTGGLDFGNVHYKGFDEYARSRDLFMIASIAIYGLSIVEAYVDGHFVTFDVSQDLSFSCTPTMLNPYTPGVNLRLNFN